MSADALKNQTMFLCKIAIEKSDNIQIDRATGRATTLMNPSNLGYQYKIQNSSHAKFERAARFLLNSRFSFQNSQNSPKILIEIDKRDFGKIAFKPKGRRLRFPLKTIVSLDWAKLQGKTKSLRADETSMSFVKNLDENCVEVRIKNILPSEFFSICELIELEQNRLDFKIHFQLPNGAVWEKRQVD